MGEKIEKELGEMEDRGRWRVVRWRKKRAEVEDKERQIGVARERQTEQRQWTEKDGGLREAGDRDMKK